MNRDEAIAIAFKVRERVALEFGAYNLMHEPNEFLRRRADTILAGGEVSYDQCATDHAFIVSVVAFDATIEALYLRELVDNKVSEPAPATAVVSGDGTDSKEDDQ